MENGQLNFFDKISAPTPEKSESETMFIPVHDYKRQKKAMAINVLRGIAMALNSAKKFPLFLIIIGL